ncbi:Peptidyl-prolyl cis-trans isomerase cyp10 [Serendipita sp. 407]|nr:Peptidyl-prolyl cis-trans isomerase cyp10 [Serendipita sp. 407]
MRSAQPSKYEPSMWTAVSGELIGKIIWQFNSRGMVAMANNGSDQNKSQFFIAYSKQPHLDSKYTIFGRVIDGADDALSMMEKVPVNAKNRPLEPITLEKITIHANPFAK